MAGGKNWWKSRIFPDSITKITFVDSYTPTAKPEETWNADAKNNGDIKCYRTGTEITVAGNGSGKILANQNSCEMFGSFYSIRTIENLRLLDTSKVTDMSSMFKTCGELTSLDVSGFNTSKVTDMRDMFIYCDKLTNLNISTWNTSNVTNMSGMFYDCSKLTTIYAGDGWNTDNVTNSYDIFYNCTNLRGDIRFNKNYTDKTYAKTSAGYLTYKQA